MTREERDMEWWTSVYTHYATQGLPSDMCKEQADEALKAFRESLPPSVDGVGLVVAKVPQGATEVHIRYPAGTYVEATFHD